MMQSNNYRKCPCISPSFFKKKLKPKIKGAAYPWIDLSLKFSNPNYYS